MKGALFCLSLILLSACDVFPVTKPLPVEKSSSPPVITVVIPAPAIASLSPSSALVGSGDVELVIWGSNFKQGTFKHAIVVWTAKGIDERWLATQVVSSTRLKASIPSTLLSAAVTADVLVMNGDVMADGPSPLYPRSNTLPFRVVSGQSH